MHSASAFMMRLTAVMSEEPRLSHRPETAESLSYRVFGEGERRWVGDRASSGEQ